MSFFRRHRRSEYRLGLMMLASFLFHLALFTSFAAAPSGPAGRLGRAGGIVLARFGQGTDASDFARSSPRAERSSPRMVVVPVSEVISLKSERPPAAARKPAAADFESPAPRAGAPGGPATGAGDAGENSELASLGPGRGWLSVGTDGQSDEEAGVIPREAVCPRPKYPQMARQRGLQGKGELQFEVLPDGSVGEIFIVKSTGFPVLDQAAMENIKQSCEFFPGRRQGEPVKMWARKSFKFVLEEAE